MVMFGPSAAALIRKLEKLNISVQSALVPLIFLQVCLAPADAEVIFSLTSSREPPVSLVPHTSAQGLIECVWGRCVCAAVEAGFFYFLLFPHKCCIFLLLFFENTHGCTCLCTFSHFVSSCGTNTTTGAHLFAWRETGAWPWQKTC